MFTLTKEYHFEAAHSLPHLPFEHKCHRLHGHSYRVVLVIEADGLDERGFAGGVEYGELEPFGRIIASLDHQNLDEIIPSPTTAENLAHWLFLDAEELFPGVVAVRVHETPTTCVEYRR